MLLKNLRTRFRDTAFQEGTPPDPVAVFESPCREVGSLRIWDDGDEATVSIGDPELTHGHFAEYDESLSEEERQAAIVESVCVFLDDLFSGRVVVWTLGSGRAGGWYYPAHHEASDLPEAATAYFWSGRVGK